MSMNREDVAHLVEALCREDDKAFHTLIEALPAILPLLVERFHQEKDGESRARIVEVIWQHRQPASIGVLSTALEDAHPAVWKQALDGLVAVGGPKRDRRW